MVTNTAQSLWKWAEIGYLETESSGLLQETVAKGGTPLAHKERGWQLS